MSSSLPMTSPTIIPSPEPSPETTPTLPNRQVPFPASRPLGRYVAKLAEQHERQQQLEIERREREALESLWTLRGQD